jgi:ABC-type Mn2+/Zn2+ transport system ATPase subunit
MAPAVVQVDSVSLTLAGNQVLHDVSFDVQSGQFACLCGPNGAGKTILLKTILSLLKPTAGKVSLFGEPAPTRAARRRVGYVPQRKAFDRSFPATVEDVIVANLRSAWPLRVSKNDREKAASALDQVGGIDLLDRQISNLSGGQMQRAFIARALVTEPGLLLLDEPMAGVDARGNSEYMDLLGRLADDSHLTAILITHSLEVVRRCATQMIYLVNGRVVAAGVPADLLQDHRLSDLAFTGHDHEHSM